MNLSRLLSYVLHPILVPILGTLFYFIYLPRHTNKDLEITVIASVLIGTYILPLVFLSVLKKTKVIENYNLEEVEDRKYPLLFCIAICYLLSTLIKKGESTMHLSLFFYGITLALFICYLSIFKKVKISLHLIGIGGLIGFISIFSFHYQINQLFTIMLLFIVSGIIASSRLILKAHTKREVMAGFFIGILAQLTPYIIYNI